MDLQISGYHIQKHMYESHNSLIYRAQRKFDHRPVVLKMLREAYPSPERIAWFKREYEVTRNINLPDVIDVYNLITDQNRWIMELEDFGGDSLSLLGIAGQLTIKDFLTVAINITDILSQIHQQQIIHKDVNPSNIILNPTTGQVKIIDFGISTVLAQEHSTFLHPNVLEGTLAYISPEQTGRMNRTMDYRTDLYSLGATLYELLTGHVPFPTTELLELLHCHLAKHPPAPHELNPAIPQPVSEMVMKLLAKNAEDRYQSAHGLKTDLEHCLRQWQSCGRIDPFLLGQNDVSDRFRLPQTLYGREAEIETLLTAFERVSQGACEMMLVTGYAGIGKTALVQEIYRPITSQRGYFVSGKFDQLQRNIPYAALIRAFRSLIRLLLAESDVHIAAWRDKLVMALGLNGWVVTDVIPEVELILGPQPEVPILAPAEAQNRFKLVFQNFIRVFAQPEHPLVLFLDDLQWADGASLKLIQAFMTGAVDQGLFLIGAYRDVEVGATHPLNLALNEMQQAGAIINHITLGPLDLPHITQFVADTLQCSQEPGNARPLAELVLSKTDGNPFFVGEFLKSLYAEELIAFDYSQGLWQWDMERIRVCEVTDNVVELMANKMRQLAQPTQHVLQLAACVGNQFDLGTLAIVNEQSLRETAAELWNALFEGLVLPLSDVYKLMELDVEGLMDEVSAEYKFAHDRIQQAAYSLIPEGDRQAIHWQVGQLLLQNTPLGQRERSIFDIVNQLNQGWRVSADQAERNELAELNLLAGKRAKSSAAYEAAFNYLQVGLSLLEENTWQRYYNLVLSLSVEAAEAAYLIGDFAEMERLADTVLAHARTLLDKVKVYEIKIQALTIQAKAREALQIAFTVLKLLGVDLPEHPDPSDITRSLQETQAALARKPIEDLIDLPAMTGPDKLAAMRILSNIMSPSHIAMPEMFPLLVMRQVNLSIQHGNSPISSVGYSLYGLILCGIVGDIEAGYCFGQLALRLLDKLNAREVRAMVVQLVAVFIRHWKEPLRAILPCLPEAYQIGLETGDLAYAGYSAHQVCTHLYFAGLELAEVDQKTAAYNAALANIKQETALQWNQVLHQAVLNLRGQADDSAGSPPCYLIGVAYDERVMLPQHQQTGNRTGIFLHYFHRLILCYLFEAYPQAVENAESGEMYLDGVASLLHVPVFYFYDSLARLAVWSALTPSEQKSSLEKVVASQEKMNTWAQHAPANYLHKYYLVEAERARVLGNAGEAREYYDQAIALAKKHGYVNEEALAQELAGKFYLARGQEQHAQLYFCNAHYAYHVWGAAAKVWDLEQQYPQWLSSKSQTQARALTDTSTSTSPVSAIDFAAVIKASQAISEEIVLEKLLTHLMEIMLENAGAETGLLLFEEGGTWVIKAEGGQPVKAFPLSMINYVARIQESVVVSDAVQEGQFTHDSYILAHQSKSVLCTPLINQGRLVGILYLENNLTTGAFTSDRLEVLQLLASQAAISIENATLYNTLEQKVAARTAELERAKEAAESANRAKSTFLANMSHELRTPLNSILGFAQILAHNPHNPEAREHLAVIIRSGEHLLTLINQVLDLAKIEAGQVTLHEQETDLFGLLDEVYNLFTLKAQEKQLQFVIACADDVPRTIRTDEIKLRQILINLIGNALKFTDAGSITVRVWTPPALGGGSSTRRLRLVFEVEDTGPGIAAEELQTLFNAFTQTRTGQEAQEGTGLGLAISQQFVHLMGGDLRVNSVVGVGTTFSFAVQVGVVASASSPSAQSQRRPITLAPDQPLYRLLIVDDQPDNRRLLMTLLQPFGFELRGAANGQKALEIWQQWQPHLIWLDLRMPDMSGYDVTQQIRAAAAGDQPKIILVSASSFEEEQTIALSKGCDDFLRKPFHETEVFDLLHKHLGVRFVYEESNKVAGSKVAGRRSQVASEEVLTPEALVALPDELRIGLQQAVEVIDMERANNLIDQIREHSEPLADVLAELVKNYRFDTLQAWFEKIKEERPLDNNTNKKHQKRSEYGHDEPITSANNDITDTTGGY